MRKDHPNLLWETIRSQTVAREIKDHFPDLREIIGRAQNYTHRMGIHRIKRGTLVDAVDKAIRDAPFEERVRLRGVVSLFDHGPRRSELWKVLDPMAELWSATVAWSKCCLKALSSEGKNPPVEYDERGLPVWAEPMEDFGDHLGKSGPLILLSDFILEARQWASASVQRESVPIARYNYDLISLVGDICPDRRRTPIYVFPRNSFSDPPTADALCEKGLESTQKAIDSASTELARFQIDIDQLKNAVRAAISRDIRQASAEYRFKH